LSKLYFQNIDPPRATGINKRTVNNTGSNHPHKEAILVLSKGVRGNEDMEESETEKHFPHMPHDYDRVLPQKIVPQYSANYTKVHIASWVRGQYFQPFLHLKGVLL
jgi:hypothetical protein